MVLQWEEKNAKSVRKEILREKKKRRIKSFKLKFHQNDSFEFWTSFPKIIRNPPPFLQSSSSKCLFCLVFWNLFVILIHVFGGIWQYNVKLENRNFYDQPCHHNPTFSILKSKLWCQRTTRQTEIDKNMYILLPRVREIIVKRLRK